MSTPSATIQLQLDKANAALLKVLDGEEVWFGDTKVRMANLDVIEKAIRSLEFKLSRAKRAESGRSGLSIRTGSFN